MDRNVKEKTTSIAEAVFNTIEQDILDGKLKNGEILTELRLCEILNVSRTPVREALKRLRQENLIVESGKGAIVVGISQKDIDDIYNIRIRLEGLAAALCCDNATDEIIRELRNTVELQEFYILRENYENLRNLDSEFHQKIYNYCGNRVLCAILSDLHRKVRHFRLTSMKNKTRGDEVIAEHRAIIEAIALKDRYLAEKLATDHVKRAYMCLEKTDGE